MRSELADQDRQVVVVAAARQPLVSVSSLFESSQSLMQRRQLSCRRK